MSIDISKETLYTLTEATKILPKVNGKRPAIATLWRWCSKGLQGVHLEHVRIGRRICTSAEALNRFANALAEAAQDRLSTSGSTYGPIAEPAPGTKAYKALRERQLREADEILRRAGI